MHTTLKAEKQKLRGWLLALQIRLYLSILAPLLYIDTIALPGGLITYPLDTRLAWILNIILTILSPLFAIACLLLIHRRRKVLLKFYLIAVISIYVLSIGQMLLAHDIGRQLPWIMMSMLLDALTVGYLMKSKRVRRTLTV